MKQYCWLLVGLLITPVVFADPQSAGDAIVSGATSQWLLLLSFGIIIYFMLIRPQSKRTKEHHRLITGLQKGDEVITNGGLLGKITKVTDNFFIILIAEGVEVPIQRQAVTTSVPKGTMKSLHP